ncbi:MAG: aldose 1-epimerase family protein [Bacteroidales bacterium]|nr:aldose 1-epimerase family protein [Bacteroidales bacterium]
MILSNNKIRIEISEKGAELVSVVKQGSQLLWNADAFYWNRHAPILFPIVGKLRGDQCRFGRRVCHMKQHGFARDSRFVPTGRVGEMRLAEKPSETVYPYDFDLTVRYVLDGEQIKVIWTVVNQGSETMRFQIGAHPGFMLLQYDENDTIHGYFRLYDAKGDLVTPSLASELEDGLRVPIASPLLKLPEELPITNDTFAKGALLIEESQVAAVELLDKDRNKVLRVDCPQAEAFGLWAPHKRGCPFVCIEPWCGIADAFGFEGDFSERKYVHRLQPQEEFKFEYAIRVY